MTLYWFETRFDKKLSPYPSPKLSKGSKKTDDTNEPNEQNDPKLVSESEIVEHIITTNIDTITLNKIEQHIAIPLKTLITPRTANRRKSCNSIPRPQNNFVLYRRNLHAIIAKEQGSATAKNFKVVSNLAAKKWADESNEIKQLFEIIADCAKKVHDYTYPEYVYQPRVTGKNGMKFRPMNMEEKAIEVRKAREQKSVVPSLLLSTFSLSKSPGIDDLENNKATNEGEGKPNESGEKANDEMMMDVTDTTESMETNDPKQPTPPPPPPPNPVKVRFASKQQQQELMNKFDSKQPPEPVDEYNMIINYPLQPQQQQQRHQLQQQQQQQQLQLRQQQQEQEQERLRQQEQERLRQQQQEQEQQQQQQQQRQQEEQQKQQQQQQQQRFLQPMDITITSNFMRASYDKHIVSLFNGYASL